MLNWVPKSLAYDYSFCCGLESNVSFGYAIVTTIPIIYVVSSCFHYYYFLLLEFAQVLTGHLCALINWVNINMALK